MVIIFINESLYRIFSQSNRIYTRYAYILVSQKSCERNNKSLRERERDLAEIYRKLDRYKDRERERETLRERERDPERERETLRERERDPERERGEIERASN